MYMYTYIYTNLSTHLNTIPSVGEYVRMLSNQ